MNSEHPEYNRDTNPYPSFGKKYNSERGIISLTSWKARINTVSKTLYSLIEKCPGFHIVLVLSEEEFPKKEEELPENLRLFIDNDLIEVLWVYKNYKSFKKVLFTMDKYRDVPVISADDDCIYTCNYAQMLYNAWDKDKKRVVNFRKSKIPYCPCGPATLYPPYLFSYFISNSNLAKQKNFQDDGLFKRLLEKIKKAPFSLSTKFPCYFHDELKPLNGSKNSAEWRLAQSFK